MDTHDENIRTALAEFCVRHRIRKLAFFRSAIRGEMRRESDLDVLVEFEPGHTPGFRFFEIEEELSHLLGRKVDLNTPGFLSRHFREDVVREAQVQYVAAR